MEIGATNVGGFFADNVAGKLLQNLLEISTRVLFCRRRAEDLKYAVSSLIPIIQEICGSGVDVPEPRRSHFDQVSRYLQEGLDVTRQVLESPRYRLYRKFQLTRKMKKLEKDISWFNKFFVQASILAEVSHMRSEGAKSFLRLEESNRHMESRLVEIMHRSGIGMAQSLTEVQQDLADGWTSASRGELGSVVERHPAEVACVAGGHGGERERDGGGYAAEEATWSISDRGGGVKDAGECADEEEDIPAAGISGLKCGLKGDSSVRDGITD